MSKDKKSEKQIPQKKLNKVSEKPSQPGLFSKENLASISEKLKLDSTLPILADAVGVPLVKSAKTVKDLYEMTKDQLKKAIDPKVIRELKKKLAEYEFAIVSAAIKRAMKEYVERYKSDEVGKFINPNGQKVERNYVLEENIDDIIKVYFALGFSEKNREWLAIGRSTWELCWENLFAFYNSISKYNLREYVSDYVEALKAGVVLTDQYGILDVLMGQKRIDRPFTADERAAHKYPALLEDYGRLSRLHDSVYSTSFSKVEILKILKKHAYFGIFLIRFIDHQRIYADYQFRKKFILDHADNLGKIVKDVSSFDAAFTNWTQFLPDNFDFKLLTSGRHLEILEKMASDVNFGGLDFRNVDIAYVNKYGDRWIKVLQSVYFHYDSNDKCVLPSFAKTDSVLTTLEKCGNYGCGYLSSKKIDQFSAEDKKNIDTFGWIVDEFVDWSHGNLPEGDDPEKSKEEREQAFIAAARPENQKLIKDSRKVLENLDLGVNSVHIFQRLVFDSILNRGDRSFRVKEFVNYCLQYPDLLKIYESSVEGYNDFDGFIEDFIVLTEKMIKICKSTNDYEVFCRVCELIANLDRSLIISLVDELGDMEQIAGFYRNRDFIVKYFKDNSLDTSLLLAFPFYLIDGNQALFQDIAKKYNVGMLIGNRAIKNAEQLKFLPSSYLFQKILEEDRNRRGPLNSVIPNIKSWSCMEQILAVVSDDCLLRVYENLMDIYTWDSLYLQKNYLKLKKLVEISYNNYFLDKTNNSTAYYRNVMGITFKHDLDKAIEIFSSFDEKSFPVIVEMYLNDHVYLEQNYLKLKRLVEIVNQKNERKKEGEKEVSLNVVKFVPKNANLDKLIEVFSSFEHSELEDFSLVLRILEEGQYPTNRFNELCDINVKYSAKVVRNPWWFRKGHNEVSADIAKTQIHATIFLLEVLEVPKEYVEEFVKEARDIFDHWTMMDLIEKYIFIDPVDGADLRNFDFAKVKKYQVVLDFFRKRGMGQGEVRLINEMNFEKFKTEMAGKDVFEIEEKLNWIGNNLDPRIRRKLEHEVFLERVCSGTFFSESLSGWVHKDANGRNRSIDVTQNNIKKINAVLRLMSQLLQGNLDEQRAEKIADDIERLFPGYKASRRVRDDFAWLVGKFDVQEINFKHVDDFSKLVEVLDLLEALKATGLQTSVDFLQKAFDSVDFNSINFDGDTYSIFKLDGVEKLRTSMNSRSRLLGDMLIDKLGSSFLEKNCCDYGNLRKLLDFAEAWENPPFEKDLKGIYDMYSNFAYVEIATFLKHEIEEARKNGKEDEVKKKVENNGIDYDVLVVKLENRGILNVRETNLQKVVGGLKQGNYAYVFRKGTQKLFGDDDVEVQGGRISMKKNNWPARKGVETYSLSGGGVELAVVIKCDPAVIKNKILIERDGLVDMEAERKNHGSKLVFSAPLTFTTGNHKMTELAFRDGEQMNYLLSPHTKDGLLLVNQSGERKVLNKTRLKVSDLLTVADLSNPDIVAAIKHWADLKRIKPEDALSQNLTPAGRFVDKRLFFEILRFKKYSLLGGMLLIDKEENSEQGTVVKLDDGSDSRRLYLEFSDGKFGVLDSTANMSTGKAVELALLVGATKAIYMDTGMYDMATYTDGNGKDHVMGHQDTSESTNRVVFYEK